MHGLPGGIAALSAVFLLSGCGTICNLVGGCVHPENLPKPYGGLELDLQVLEGIGGLGTPPSGGSAQTADPRFALFVIALICTDPMLTLVGDTLTLPLTLYIEDRRQAARTQAHAVDIAEPIPGAVPAELAFHSAMPCSEMTQVEPVRVGDLTGAISTPVPVLPPALPAASARPAPVPERGNWLLRLAWPDCAHDEEPALAAGLSLLLPGGDGVDLRPR